MIYIPWIGFYEGSTDASYFDVLLPRIMEAITLSEGIQSVVIPPAPAVRLTSRAIDKVAEEVCHYAGSFHLLFIHADTGGRSLEDGLGGRSAAYCRAIRMRCDWPIARCIVIAPRHETEAWVLADRNAVLTALGITGTADKYGLPVDAADAETLPDPKRCLEEISRRVRGRRARRGGSDLFPIIAQTQTFGALRGSRSFQTFEAALRKGLIDLGCLKRQDH